VGKGKRVIKSSKEEREELERELFSLKRRQEYLVDYFLMRKGYRDFFRSVEEAKDFVMDVGDIKGKSEWFTDRRVENIIKKKWERFLEKREISLSLSDWAVLYALIKRYGDEDEKRFIIEMSEVLWSVVMRCYPLLKKELTAFRRRYSLRDSRDWEYFENEGFLGILHGVLKYDLRKAEKRGRNIASDFLSYIKFWIKKYLGMEIGRVFEVMEREKYSYEELFSDKRGESRSGDEDYIREEL